MVAGTGQTGFGDRLKLLREAAGISQRALAEAAGMNIYGVAKIEQGQREPAWSTVVALANALGCTPNDFIGRTPMPPADTAPAAEPPKATAKKKPAGKPKRK